MTRTTTMDAPAMAPEAEELPMALPCPSCGQAEAMAPLGTRVDHPRRWLRWARAITHIYICTRCCAVAELTELAGRGAAL